MHLLLHGIAFFKGPVIKCRAALPSRSVNKLSTSSRWGALDAFPGCVRSTFQVRLVFLSGFSCGAFEVRLRYLLGAFEVRLKCV